MFEKSSFFHDIIYGRPLIHIFLSAKIGVRHLQVFLLFSCLLIAYSLRVNLSIGIVAMTDNSSNPDFVVNLVSTSNLFIKFIDIFLVIQSNMTGQNQHVV